MMDAKATKEALKNISKAIHRINSSEFEWNLDILIAAHEMLIERSAPFKVGQRVQLVKDVDCSDAPGWKCSEHFLKKGAMATVDSVEVRKEKRFAYYLIFDNETWLSDQGPKPVSQRHAYCFGESSIEARSSEPAEPPGEAEPSPRNPTVTQPTGGAA